MHHYDVVIIGAGPAGAATALALRKAQPQRSVVLIEASDFQSVRPGETVSLDLVTLLQQLDVFDFFLEQNHRQLSQHVSFWGSSAATSHSVNESLVEGGWYVDRARFDSMLAGFAAASGASFIRAALTNVHSLADGTWEISAQSSTVSHIIKASFVVDASGRSARFASEIGVRQFAQDTMVGIVRVIESPRYKYDEKGTLIEAFEHGWWYSAPLPENRLAVVAMTDADISKRLQLTHIEEWTKHVHASPQTSERLGDIKVTGDACVRAAHTRHLLNCVGKNWLAVGDAAASVDPLSSQGILRALHFGIHAGNAITEHFSNRESCLQHYEELVHTEFNNSVSLCIEKYRSESRWATCPFWARRHMPPAIHGGQKKAILSIADNAAAGETYLAKHTTSALHVK